MRWVMILSALCMVAVGAAQERLPELLRDWDPRGPLPDFSWGGYQAGEQPIPDVPVVVNVRDLGAVGDGEADDSAAVLAAIERAGAEGGGAVFFPPGRYRIAAVIRCPHDNVVLRGAGQEETTLFFPAPLAELEGENRNWGWSGGLIWPAPPARRSGRLTTVTADADRGDTELTVEAPTRVQAGDMVELRMHNTDAELSLLRYLFGGHIDPFGDILTREGSAPVQWRTEVVAVDGNRVTLRQPLRMDVRTEWNPALHEVAFVRGFGVESLRIEFPPVEYAGHGREPGYNAVYLDHVLHGWVRDVTIHDCDSGVIGGGAKWCTVQDMLITGRPGHYGFQSRTNTADCLFQRFRITARPIHTLSIQHKVSGNVYTTGEVVNLTCDSHRDVPLENLYDNITSTCLRGFTNPMASSGTAARFGPAAAVRNTYWNLRFIAGEDAAETLTPRRLNEFPEGIFVGWHGDIPLQFPDDAPSGIHVESIGQPVEPQSLYAYQVRQRLGREPY